jgi:agmatine deiminase
MQVCNDPSDENFKITRENLEILQNSTDAKNRKFEIIPIEQPPMMEYEGSRLTLSYLNFYLVNGGIVLPVFGGIAEKTDKLAIKTLQASFPDRKIKTVNGMAVITEGGNVHCTTQQMAAPQKV